MDGTAKGTQQMGHHHFRDILNVWLLAFLADFERCTEGYPPTLIPTLTTELRTFMLSLIMQYLPLYTLVPSSVVLFGSFQSRVFTSCWIIYLWYVLSWKKLEESEIFS